VINNDFIGFLRLIVSPEAGEVYSNAYNILTQTGETKHEFAITQYIATADNDDTSTSIAFIEQALALSLADRLGDHGILLADQSLPLMTELLNACSSIDSYGDPETIYNICVSDDTPEVKLCEIMEFFSPHTWVEYFPIIATVSPDFIKAITALLRERAEVAMEEIPDVDLVARLPDIRDRTLSYTAGKPDLQILRLIREGMPLGLDMELYVAACKELLSTMAPMRLIPELVAIANASVLLKEDLAAGIREQIESLYGNLTLVTQANIALSREGLQ